MHEKEKIEQRWPAAISFIRERKLNEVFDGDIDGVGIILQGGMYNGVLQGFGLADVWAIPVFRSMSRTSPPADDEDRRFCRSKRAVLMVEGPARLHQQACTDSAHGRYSGKTARASCRSVAIYGGRDGGGCCKFSPCRPEVLPTISARRTIHLSSAMTRSRHWSRWCRRAHRLLHRLSRAADLRGHEAGRKGSRSPSHRGRYRLPSVRSCRRSISGRRR